MAFLKLRGYVKIAERLPSGAPGVFFDPGCAAQLALALSEEVNEIREKCSGQDGVAFRDVTAQNGTLSLQLYDARKNNLLMALQGTDVATVTQGSVTGEALPEGIVAGSSVRVGGVDGHQNISNVAVEANSVPLVLGTDYTISAVPGVITFITTPTAPVEVDYEYEDMPKIAMLNAAAKEYFINFDARNKADNFNPAVAELYRIRFSPLANLDLLPDEVTIMELEGTLLVDDKKPADSVLGKFGWISYLDEA